MRTFVPAQLARRWTQVAAEIERSRGSLGVEEVHDLRVALRRYNEALQLFERWTGRRYAKALRGRMKPLRQTAGQLRDLDVAAELLTKAGSAISLEFERDEARTRLAAALTARFEDPPPPLVIEEEPAGQVARTLLPKMAKQYFRTGSRLRAGNPAGEQLHDFRIEGKHFRYALELFAPLYGPALGRRIGSLRKVQGVLGDLNDCAVLSAMPGVREDARLFEWLEARSARKREEFSEVWDSEFSSARTWSAYLRRWARMVRSI